MNLGPLQVRDERDSLYKAIVMESSALQKAERNGKQYPF
jgi:hypothetical protein